MKKIGKYIMIYTICIASMFGLLFLSTLIPQSAIEENAKKSADIKYAVGADTHYLNEDNRTTYIDDYAECMWLNIAYHMNSPKQMITDSIYYENLDTVTSYRDAVYQNQEVNYSYSRYWHGSVGVIRGLLTVFDINGIHYLNIGVLVFLIGMNVYMMLKRNEKLLALVFGMGLLFTGIYTVPFCMEYVPAYLIMLIMNMLVLKYDKKYYPIMFFISGMMTAYFDFLTSETLTLTIPLFIYIVMEYREEQSSKKVLIDIIKLILLWGIGYGCTFLTKWLLVFLVDGKQSLVNDLSQAYRRINVLTGDNRIVQLFWAFVRPLTFVFPVMLGKTNFGVLTLLTGTAIAIVMSWLIFSKRAMYQGTKWGIVLLGILPLMRFIFLNNHTYVHPFFTYRALLVSIMSVLYIIIFTAKKTEEESLKNDALVNKS